MTQISKNKRMLNITVIIFVALALTACSSNPKPPKTQTASSAKRGAMWGGLAGLVFGGDLSDVVAGAAIGGAGGAVYGSAKGKEQLKAQENDLARQQVRVEQERNYILEQEMKQQNVQTVNQVKPTDDLLVRAFGQDNVNSLNALTQCDHQRAQLYAMAGANSDFVSHRLAALYLEAMIAEDQRNINDAHAAYLAIIEADETVATEDRARLETLDALADVRAERKLKNITCT